MLERFSIETKSKKYKFTILQDGAIRIYRNGELWLFGSEIKGNKMMIEFLTELEELRNDYASLREDMNKIDI